MKIPPYRPILAVFLLFFTAIAAAEGGEQTEFQPPEELEAGWYVRMETDMGRIVARLLPDQAPQTVAHFAALAEGRMDWVDPTTGETRDGPFYDGTVIYRVEAGSRFEAGDPPGMGGGGRGGPAMFVPKEGMGPVNFGRPGRLGMTKVGGMVNSAYRFFVTYAAQPRMNGHLNCFGEVVSGLDVVMKISGVKSYSNGMPLEPIVISEVRIFKVGDPPPLPEPKPYKPERKKFTFERRGTAQ